MTAPEPRRRVVQGVGLPLAAIAFIALLLYSFSRILLAVDPDIAPWVALLFALNVLVGSTLAALLRGRRAFAFLTGVIVATIIAGGIAGAVVGEWPIPGHAAPEAHGGEGGAPAEEGTPAAEESPAEEGSPSEAGGATVDIVAQALAFDTSELQLPAGQAVTIHFDNQDAGQTHNVSIYTEAGGEPLFQGEPLITGPDEVDYQVPPLEAGTFYFQCDVHPQMNGMVTVA